MNTPEREWIAICALIGAGLVSYTNLELQHMVEQCDDARASLERTEIISALDIIVIDEIVRRSTGIRSLALELPCDESEEAISQLERTLDEAPNQKRDAIRQYLDTRQLIRETDQVCSGLDFPRWLVTLFEWLANLIAGVLVFIAGLQVGTKRLHKTKQK